MRRGQQDSALAKAKRRRHYEPPNVKRKRLVPDPYKQESFNAHVTRV